MAVGGGPAILLVAAFVLAGCTDAQADESQNKVIKASVAPAPKTILLRILVINDEYLPVQGASVRVVGLGLNATTDDVGNAYFQVAKAGRYAVHVHHARFYPNISKVRVDEGEDTVHRVFLRDAPGHQHFRDYYFYEGICAPTAYVLGATGDGSCPETAYASRGYARWLLNKGLEEARVQLAWVRQPSGPERMRLEVTFPGLTFADGSTTRWTEGTSPINLTIEKQLFTQAHLKPGNPIEVRASLARDQPVNVNVYQPYELAGEFDYYIEAPDVDPDA